MQKLFTLCVSALMAITSICAQDIIVTKDAKKIEAKITEVTTSEIRYKEIDNLNGPIFILRIDEINSIIYDNGKVVLYNQQDLAKQREDEELRRKQEEAARAKVEAEERAKKEAVDLIGSFNFAEEPSAAPPCGKQAGPAKGGYGSWQLEGRGLVGALPKPANTFDQVGRVVVQITVDASGNVIEAMVIGGNVTDYETIRLAIDAAKKAKFTSSKQNKQVGKITYNFKFN